MKLFKKVALLSALTLITTMNISQAAVNRIKNEEGFRSSAYADGMVNGVQMHSIGYGHQIQPGQTNLLTMKISADTAETLLRSDISPLEAQINSTLKAVPTQNQFDALIDFGFNCGSGALSKVISTWNANTAKGLKAVTDQILLYNKTHVDGELVVSNTLKDRRESEVDLFNSSLSPTAKTATKIAAIAGIGLAAAALVLTRA